MATYNLSINNRENEPALVQILKLWLNAVGAVNARSPLTVDQTFDQATTRALRTFQGQHALPVNGVCGIRTWQALCRQVNRQARAELTNFEMRQWLVNLLNERTMVEGGRLSVDHALFLTMYGAEFGRVTENQTAGLNSLLDYFGEDADVNDVRWMAYMLATVKIETAHTFRPIEEIGKGAGRKTHRNRKTGKIETWYGTPVEVTCDGRRIQHVYYGRGYVQLTWHEHYVSMGAVFNRDLECHPELAYQDAALSYKIMSHGMRTGAAFANGRKLEDYINQNETDYIRARALVNGSNEADMIAGWAHTFEAMVRACLLN